MIDVPIPVYSGTVATLPDDAIVKGQETVTVGYAYPYADVGYQVEKNRENDFLGPWSGPDLGAPVWYDEGGLPGDTSRGQWSIGPVESGTVEDFDLHGARIRLRRPPEGNYGPVGGTDYLSDLAAAIATGNVMPPTDETVAAATLGLTYEQ